MIKQKTSRVYRDDIEKLIKDRKAETASDILDIIFGTYENGYDTDYDVQDIYAKERKANILQRFNMVWVYPLFIITIPVQYIITGRYGVTSGSTMRRVIEFIAGPLK